MGLVALFYYTLVILLVRHHDIGDVLVNIFGLASQVSLASLALAFCFTSSMWR